MGIFSSKKKTYVGSSASRLVDDNMVPNSVLSGTMRAVLQDGDIADSMIRDLARGLSSKARRMYTFGRNGYVFGTPDAAITTSTAGEEQVLAVLASLYPSSTVGLSYSHLGAPNILHIGWLKLLRDHGFDPVTNKLANLSTSIGKDVFLHDMVVVVPAGSADLYYPASLEQWGTPAKTRPSPSRANQTVPVLALNGLTKVELSATASEDHVRVEYAWKDAANTLQKSSFTIGNSEYDEAKDYIHAEFLVDGELHYWIYEVGTGTHPTLDALLDLEPSTLGSFFPFIHFRSNKQSMAANTSSLDYTDSVKMAKKLGVDYMQIHDAIHENPDIGDVAQAYLGLLVPVTAVDALSQRYLFDFFDGLYEAGLGIPPVASSSAVFLMAKTIPQVSITVQDKKIKHTLSCSGMSKRLVAGTLPEGKEYATGFSAADKYHYFRHQVTSSVYTEVLVYRLEMRYWVDGTHSAVGDEDDATMLIPVDFSITRAYPMKDQEQLYARSLHLICNSSITIKIRWYQRGVFATFLKIVGVAMIIFDGGFTAGLSAAAAAGVVQVIAFVVITVIVQVGVTMLYQLAAKILGPDFAILLAAAAVFYGGYKVLTEGLKTALPMLETMLQTATGLIQGTAKVVMDDLLELGKEFDAFSKESEEKMDLLEETKKLLEGSNRLNPLVIFGESPENYYNRTVHSGNVGIIGYRAIESYVDLALTLPTISDTIEGDIYA